MIGAGQGLDIYMNEVHDLVVTKSWNPDFRDQICRLHGEISEAFEKWSRGGTAADVAEELSDAFIFLMGLFWLLDESPQEHYCKKMVINWKRDNAVMIRRGEDG